MADLEKLAVQVIKSDVPKDGSLISGADLGNLLVSLKVPASWFVNIDTPGSSSDKYFAVSHGENDTVLFLVEQDGKATVKGTLIGEGSAAFTGYVEANDVRLQGWDNIWSGSESVVEIVGATGRYQVVVDVDGSGDVVLFTLMAFSGSACFRSPEDAQSGVMVVFNPATDEFSAQGANGPYNILRIDEMK